jgi:hypothetical protein
LVTVRCYFRDGAIRSDRRIYPRIPLHYHTITTASHQRISINYNCQFIPRHSTKNQLTSSQPCCFPLRLSTHQAQSMHRFRLNRYSYKTTQGHLSWFTDVHLRCIYRGNWNETKCCLVLCIGIIWCFDACCFASSGMV